MTGATGYAMRCALGGPARAEIELDASLRGGPGDHLAVAVSRGVCNIVPARWDPLFRRRLRRRWPQAEAELMHLDPGACKTEVVRAIAGDVLGMRTWMIDPAGDEDVHRVRLLGEPQGSDGAALDRAAGGREPRRSTTELLVVTIGRDREVEDALTMQLAALSVLCGGRTLLRASLRLAPAVRRIVVPLKSRTDAVLLERSPTARAPSAA